MNNLHAHVILPAASAPMTDPLPVHRYRRPETRAR